MGLSTGVVSGKKAPLQNQEGRRLRAGVVSGKKAPLLNQEGRCVSAGVVSGKKAPLQNQEGRRLSRRGGFRQKSSPPESGGAVPLAPGWFPAKKLPS